MDKFFHNDFERGETDTYNVNGEDVGEVVMLTLNNNREGFGCDWYIAKITVEKELPGGSEKYFFPCYRWVVSQLVVYEGKGTLLCRTPPPPPPAKKVINTPEKE